MDEVGMSDLELKLSTFARRLESRISEFRATGQLSSVHHKAADEIAGRYAELRARVDEAIQNGTAWDVIKAELARDYRSLFDSFVRWEDRLDSEMSRNQLDRL